MRNRRGGSLAAAPVAVAAVWLLGAVFSCPTAGACSAFSLSSDAEMVVGRNLDWDRRIPGLVLVNVRGVEKTVLPWRGDRPDTASCWPTVSWASRYGSVTFTCYGRDFIESGMNEAGLVVCEANLPTEFPPRDERPRISCAQWLQYLLDNCATVADVLAHLEDLRPDGEEWHFLFADRGGDCAIVEFVEGRAEVHRGIDDCAITNAPYSLALRHLALDEAFGGSADIAAHDDSYGRFVRMARLNRDFDPKSGTLPRTHAVSVLRAVSTEETVRSIVYDAAESTVLWRTRANPFLRSVDFDDFDFTVGAVAMMLDIDAPGSGDVSGEFQAFSPEANLSVAIAAFDAIFRHGEGASSEMMEAARSGCK